VAAQQETDQVTITPGRKFYAEQLDYLAAKDVDGLVANHYNDDAVLISFDVTVKGREALRDYFRTYLERLGTLTVTSTDKFMETEDSIFFEATVTSNLGTVRVYDAFVLRDGKISYHFAGVIGPGDSSR
jgi:ketosteroid isomerase-like protein